MRLQLPLDVVERLTRALRIAGRREIGGVLMGEQTGTDEFQIADFSLDAKTGSAAHFVRTPEEHQAALDAFFERTGHDYKRYNYLGEWHSHPSYSTRPSLEDIWSMERLVNGENSIDFAVLVIVRHGFFKGFEATAYLFAKGRPPRPIQLRWRKVQFI
jgi:integrative and conjugative element protein (TIGR02256 family)